MDETPPLEREAWESGWQVRMHARGWLRFLPAAFLGFWLCGWAVGEFFAGGFAWALIASRIGLEAVPGGFTDALPGQGGAAMLILAFLAVWLTFWTFGGVMAAREMLRLLIGREAVRWDSQRIEAESWAGPFRSVSRIAGDDLRGIRVHRGRLEADTRRGRVVLLTLGDRHEREALCTMMRETLAPWLAAGRRWSVEGEPLAVAGWKESRESGPPALVAGPAWLGARLEPGAGTLTRRIRVGPLRWEREWRPLELTLSRERDSDGDELWVLRAEDANGRDRLHSSLEDPAPAYALGEWLERHTGVSVRETWGPLGERRSA